MLPTMRLQSMIIIGSLFLMLGANAFAQSSVGRVNPMADLATHSAEEFVHLIKYRCANVSPNSEDSAACIKDAARLWLANYAWQYESIPDSYITGNSLARDFLARP
ncbi:hypothetical protein PPMP20_17675 [Paraburkholderia phymatum]|uniref:Uncharacterized protein n=1 Tax=Paraburkholderia phymatum (strain DSM 17167 / CIP 108236 / LMG 21445 / STM815) TaxID=391038 RepID=B2JTJ1_PARP8|nr:hypothetical protein [Paraburkholderia phymatum]ACC75894.1 hypothetical protein Bphy_6883 [Paraburkholderia phymatum STM815]